MNLDARGIAFKDEKRVLVDSALPGERVMAHKVKLGAEYDKAHLDEVIKPSSQRVTPACQYFGMCGGCKMQHLAPEAQVAVKQRALEEAFLDQGSLKIEHVLAPVHGPYWNYRYRARLSVRNVPKKGGVLVGFRERNGSYVVDMTSCQILPKSVSDMLQPLRELMSGLSNPHRYPQIEVSVGDRTTALVLRHLEPMTENDFAALRAFAKTWNVSWWLQPKGPETVAPLDPGCEEDLAYTLPEFDLRMVYKPADFTQVNPYINRVLIHRALRLLEPGPQDRVADLFCGLGNFSLPLARVAGSVVGVEGNKALTERAMEGAVQHGLQDKAAFQMLNLFEVDVSWLRSLGYFDRMLIDPPREGAEAVSEALADLDVSERPKRIVYVSCNPVTLARDAAILVHRGNYRLCSAGVVNMFPHTGHVESIAVFES